ncbi:MAG: hypothetical protein K6L81_02640 [Agarilytica sp.]
MIEEELGTFLNTLLTAPAFYVEAPAGQSLPFVTFELQHYDTDHQKGGSGLAYAEFQIDVYHHTPGRAAVLGTEVKEALQNFKGQMGELFITLARISSEFDSDEKASGSYVRTMTLSINHQ